jgi:hypothetical protein
MFVSSLSRDPQKALVASLLLLALLIGGGPAGDALCAAVQNRPFHPLLSLSSPGFLFIAADAWGQTPFWPALLVNQGLAWLMLGLTCLWLPRTWQEREARTVLAQGSCGQWWRLGSARRQALLRHKLVGGNPVLWLACRERWQAALLWAMALLAAGGAGALFAGDGQPGPWMMVGYLGGLLTLALYLGLASHASRFFVEARRSGLLELVLSTPLTARQVVQGQWRAVLRMFAPPLLLYLAVQLVATVMAQQMTWRAIAAATTTLPPVTTTVTPSNAATLTFTSTVTSTRTTFAWKTSPLRGTVPAAGFDPTQFFTTLATSLIVTLATAVRLVALTWFGMWMGMNSKTNHLATLKTIAFVQVLPWFVITFASTLTIPLLLMQGFLGGASFMVWYRLFSIAFTAVLSLGKDTAFILWSRKKLYSDFRDRVAEVSTPTRTFLPPPLPPAGLPPVIVPG